MQPSSELEKENALPEAWRRWIAENKMLKVGEQQLVDILEEAGFNEVDSRRELQALDSIPAYQAGVWLAQRLRKLESILGLYRSLSELSSQSQTIERRQDLSRTEFLEEYYAKNRPVVLAGMMQNWRALSVWNPDYLKSVCGDETIEVMTGRESNPFYEIELDKHRTSMVLKDFIDMVVSGGATNDYYLVANNFFFKNEKAKRLYDDIEMFPEYLDANDRSDTGSFWFGPAGTVTHLHHDLINILAAQVYGRKHVILASPNQTPLLYNNIGVYSQVNCEEPDYERHPLFKDVRTIDLILEPGEVLFIPVGWWHYVKALEVSITVSFTNFLFPNRYGWNNPSRFA